MIGLDKDIRILKTQNKLMLESVAKHHKEWVVVVNRFGGGHYSEDIVQEMYIKLYKYSSKEKCMSKGIVNKYYIFKTLKSIVNTYFKEKKRVTKVSESCLYNVEQKCDDENQLAHKLIGIKIEDEIESWHWYDKDIFNLYRNEKISYRKIQLKTKIHWTSIYRTINRCKAKLKANIGEDYSDFINEDYELIK